MTTQKILADRPSRVETMTGLSSDQVDRLVLSVYATRSLDPARRRVVGPYRAVLIVLLYLRHSLSQALIAELFGCSQPTVSRLVGRLMPIITEVLSPTADATAKRELRSTVRVDGFLAVTGTGARTPTRLACTPVSATRAASTSRSSARTTAR